MKLTKRQNRHVEKNKTTANRKQAKFFARGCSNAWVDNSKKLTPTVNYYDIQIKNKIFITVFYNIVVPHSPLPISSKRI